MAKKEIYKLDIEIGVKGDAKAQSTLKTLDKYATLTEKRLKKINKAKVSPTAKLNDKLSSPLSRLERQTERLNRVVQSTVTLNDRVSPSISRIDSNLDTLENGAQANITANDNASDVIDRIDSNLDSIAQGNEVAITANDNASGTIAHVDGELESLPGSVETTITVNDQATETIRNIDMSLKDIEKGISSVGKKASVGLTAPILGVGTASAMASMDFETSMNKVSALSGATGDELASLEAKAREMGKTTQFSAKDSADALGFMSLAGWNATQMTEALGPVLNLAGSAQMGLAEASDIVTDTMSMFGMEATEAAKATDIFATAQAKSNTDVKQLSEALKYSGAAANAMGYDLADTSAILGTFANAGLKGSTAGTTLNSMFRDMKDKAEKGAIAIGENKVAIQDAQGNYRDFTDIMGDVIKATEGMSQAEADAAMSAVFGTEALKGVNIMREQGIDSTRELEEAIRNSDGAAKAMNDTMQNGLKGTIDNFKSSVGEAAIVIGDKLSPYIQKAVEWLTQAVDWFSSLDGSTLAIIGTFAGLLAIIGPILMIGSKLISTIGFMSNGFSVLSGIMSGTSAVAGGTAVTIAGVSASAILIPAAIALVVAAFAGMGVALSDNESALLKLQDKFGTFGTVVGGIMEGVGGIVKLVVGNILNLVGGVAETIGILFSKKSWGEKMSALKATWKETWADAKVITRDAMSDINNETTNATRLLSESTSTELQGVSNAFEVALGQTENIANKKSSDVARTFTNGIQNLNDDSLTIMRGLNDEMAILLSGVTESMDYDEKVKKITKNLDDAFKSGKISADEYAKGISESMEFLNANCSDSAGNLKQSLSDVFNAFKDGMDTGGVEDAITGMMNSLNAAPEQVQGVVQNMNGIMGDLFKGVDFNAPVSEQISKVVSNFEKLGIDGPAAIDAARSLFVEAAGKIPDDVANAVEPTTSKVAETLNQGTTQLQQSGNELGTSVGNGVVEGMDSTKAAIETKSTEITNATQSGVSNAVDGANSEWATLPQGVDQGFASATQSVQQGATNMYNGAKQSFSGLAEIGRQAGSDLYNGVSTSLNMLSTNVKVAASAMYNGASTSFRMLASTGKQEMSNLYNGATTSANMLATNVKVACTNMYNGSKTSFTSLSSSAISTITSMCSTVTSKVSAMASSVISQWNSIRSTVSKPITASFSVTTTQTTVKKSVDGGSSNTTTKHATGGIFTTPHYALFAEEPGGEAVIPLNGKRRDRAVSLWQETGEKLGMNTEDRYRNAGNQSSYFTKANNSSSKRKEKPDYDVDDYGTNPYYGFEPYSPQVTVAGGSFDVNVEVYNKFDSDIDEEYIIDETCNKVGVKLREAFKNIKK